MKYEVIFESYAERHYMKSFEKKYLRAWEKTLKSLEIEFSRVDLLFQTQIAVTISTSADDNISICKTEFKILGTNLSRHASGNRCIIAVHNDTASVHVLLVYSKSDLSSHNETTEWKKIIKNNYPKYGSVIHI